MVIGYLTMHFTFVSLFLNMRTMGSKFWLGATVLISSTFSFLLALATVDYFRSPYQHGLNVRGIALLGCDSRIRETIHAHKGCFARQGIFSHSVNKRQCDGRRSRQRPRHRERLFSGNCCTCIGSSFRGSRVTPILFSGSLDTWLGLCSSVHFLHRHLIYQVGSSNQPLKPSNPLDQSYKTSYRYSENVARRRHFLQNGRVCRCCGRSR